MSENAHETNGLTDFQQSYVNGLRLLADKLESNPDLMNDYGITLYKYVWSKADEDGNKEPKEFARQALLLGPSEKNANETTYEVTALFGPHRFTIYTERDAVCTKVVTGTRVETTSEYDPELLAAVPKVTYEKVIEEVEWICPPSLHDLAKS